jgi:hypothetical protein
MQMVFQWWVQEGLVILKAVCCMSLPSSSRVYQGYFTVPQKISCRCEYQFFLLKRYKQLNTTHQLFIKHTKTTTCFGFIN